MCFFSGIFHAPTVWMHNNSEWKKIHWDLYMRKGVGFKSHQLHQINEIILGQNARSNGMLSDDYYYEKLSLFGYCYSLSLSHSLVSMSHNKVVHLVQATRSIWHRCFSWSYCIACPTPSENCSSVNRYFCVL